MWQPGILITILLDLLFKEAGLLLEELWCEWPTVLVFLRELPLVTSVVEVVVVVWLLLMRLFCLETCMPCLPGVETWPIASLVMEEPPSLMFEINLVLWQ